MNATLRPLRDLLATAIPELSPQAWEDFQEIWAPVSVRRKTVLSSPGYQEKFLYFVLEGVQRVYFFDQNSREATLVFTYPYSFAGVLDAFLLQCPSKYYFETISDSQLLRTRYDQFHRIQQQHPCLREFVDKTLHTVIAGLLQRMVELQCFTSEEKFTQLLKRSPHLLQVVPQKYLANYIGVDPTNFSKLINKVRM
ncbi:Crp/Fnr family transcriptional regulator [Dyadobacter tibetensis]|uniref:Crp/Fnr family transcriptional regulator n=1 Tax=Dyadobacter tibetensis TaxID=1211851 RepID=UPI00046FCCC5|nr:Crp/Fnr family transcriptional regulator [Dyadobacter tibetensis]